MDDFSDWCIVAPVNSFGSTNEKVEEICINTDEENSSESPSSKNDSSNSNGEDVKNNYFSALSDEKGVTEIRLDTSTTNIDEIYVSRPHVNEDYSVRIVAASSKNLWVSGLTEMTRTNDLKTLFSKYGKVLSVNIIKNVKTPRTCYYGLVTMSSSEEAVTCFEKLNKLHDPNITFEKTTIEQSESIKGSDLKSMQSEAPSNKSEKSAESSEDVTSISSQLPNLVTSSYTRSFESTRPQSLNESSEKFSETCHLKTEKTPRKQDVLQQSTESSTNTGLQDISGTDSSCTSDKRKGDEKSNKGFRLLGVRKVNYRDQDSFSFLPFWFQEERFSTVLHLFCCIFVFYILNITDNLPKISEISSLNDTITMLQKENFLLKRQISFNQRKENRKLTSLSNVVSIKFEEKENVTRKYLHQLELEALYLKEINSLKEKVSSLEAKYKISQNHFTEDATVEEIGENYEELPGSSSNIEEHDNVKKRKLHEEIKNATFLCLSFALMMFLTCLFCLSVSSAISETRKKEFERNTHLKVNGTGSFIF